MEKKKRCLGAWTHGLRFQNRERDTYNRQKRGIRYFKLENTFVAVKFSSEGRLTWDHYTWATVLGETELLKYKLQVNRILKRIISIGAFHWASQLKISTWEPCKGGNIGSQ